MDMTNIADLEALVQDDRRAARRFFLTYVVRALGIGVCGAIGDLIWKVWAHGAGAIGFNGQFPTDVIIFFVIFAFLAFALQQVPHPCEWHISDSTLLKLAAAKIADTSGLDTLKTYMRADGFITLQQVATFLEAEQRERKRLARLRKPGAKALLS